MIDSKDIYYGICDCWIWPLIRFCSVGRCGRCRTRPEGRFDTKDQAFDAYYAEHGTVPTRMGT